MASERFDLILRLLKEKDEAIERNNVEIASNVEKLRKLMELQTATIKKLKELRCVNCNTDRGLVRCVMCLKILCYSCSSKKAEKLEDGCFGLDHGIAVRKENFIRVD